jgi:hypothetical protein
VIGFVSCSGHCHMEMEWIDRNKENKILIETNKEILIERKQFH